VGKTNIVANLGFALGQSGRNVLIFDADLGLGNIDVLLGITPKYNLSHVIIGEKGMGDIMVEGPGNISILPASSGIQELTELSEQQKMRIQKEFDSLTDTLDVLLIDTAAGVSSNVMYFNAVAQEVVVVVSPEPTSITDAYALMKVLSLKHGKRQFKLLVNLANGAQEAYEVYRQLALVADRFLTISIEYVGYVPFDEKVTKCVKRQRVVSEVYPDTTAAKSFACIAEKIWSSTPAGGQQGSLHFLGDFLQKND
jgi:flagellar biosynthesis protein FlhG